MLYPDDSTEAGRTLPVPAAVLLVSCSIQAIPTRFHNRDDGWTDLPEHVAIQLNDTHPALSVAELMRC